MICGSTSCNRIGQLTQICTTLQFSGSRPRQGVAPGGNILPIGSRPDLLVVWEASYRLRAGCNDTPPRSAGARVVWSKGERPIPLRRKLLPLCQGPGRYPDHFLPESVLQASSHLIAQATRSAPRGGSHRGEELRLPFVRLDGTSGGPCRNTGRESFLRRCGAAAHILERNEACRTRRALPSSSC